MNRTIAPAPVRKSVRVKVPPARAFEIWTTGMSRWWIKTHTINPTKSPIKEIILEPRRSGRWFERGEDGRECQWGKVLAWEPPTRLVLAWQVDGQWQFDPNLITEVELRFTPDGSGTLIELEHRHLERLGDAAEAIGGDGGWAALLEGFAKEAAG
ncbi:MAG: SRPBCC family protein [Stellaceae bacterium]